MMHILLYSIKSRPTYFVHAATKSNYSPANKTLLYLDHLSCEQDFKHEKLSNFGMEASQDFLAVCGPLPRVIRVSFQCELIPQRSDSLHV